MAHSHSDIQAILDSGIPIKDATCPKCGYIAQWAPQPDGWYGPENAVKWNIWCFCTHCEGSYEVKTLYGPIPGLHTSGQSALDAFIQRLRSDGPGH
jgi:hypothetical protein